MESAHANTKVGFSGHCLESSGKSIKYVSKEKKTSYVKKTLKFWIFLLSWSDFAAKTENESVVESFGGIWSWT